MTFSVTGIVQTVAARTNGDDGVVITGSIDSSEDGPVITGSFTLEVRQNEGLQVPEQGDRVNLSGWFSYDDGSRAEVPADLPEDTTGASGS